MNIILLIPLIVSFLIVLLAIPNWIKRAKMADLVGKDIHKNSEEMVAESGGVVVILGFILGVLSYIAIKVFILDDFTRLVEIFSLLSSILLIAFVAFTDDILGWKIGLKKSTRLIMVGFASIPLVAINAGQSIISLPIMGDLNLGITYALIIIPVGVIGATTTFNFLAGFNGLEAGQGVLILTAISILTYYMGNQWLSLISLCMVFSLLAFLLFNISPAKVFPGDSLTYSVGGLIAILAILGNFEKIAIFFFIPCILETGLKLRGRLKKESFAKIDQGGFLNLRYDKVYSLTHLATFLLNKTKLKATENRVVILIWAFQTFIILTGFLIFKDGIFI